METATDTDYFVLSSSKASCNTFAASAVDSSLTKHVIRISEVVIISMLILPSERAANIFAA